MECLLLLDADIGQPWLVSIHVFGFSFAQMPSLEDILILMVSYSSPTSHLTAVQPDFPLEIRVPVVSLKVWVRL